MKWRFVRRWGEASKLCGCIGGVAAVLAMLLVRWTAGSPYFFLSQMKQGSLWMPVWLISLLWLAWYFTMGFLWGLLLGDGHNRTLVRAVWFYRGSLYFLLGLFFGLMWYPLLFRICMPFFSLLILVLAGGCFCVAGICWLRITRPGGFVTFGYCGWLLFIALTQLVMLLNH